MQDKRMRVREAGLSIGYLPTGPNNAITDVEGLRVGHRTVWRGEPGRDEPVVRSGVTAVIPHPGDLFRERLYAGVSVFNGYGEMTSKIVIDEWGLLGSPVMLTDSIRSMMRPLPTWLTETRKSTTSTW
jgi:D-aminopeptidase